MTEQAETIRFERSYVTDSRYPQRVANAAARFLWRRPIYWLPYVVGFAFILVIGIFQIPSALPFGARAFIAVISGLVIYGIVIPLQMASLRRRIRRTAFADAKLSISFSDTALLSDGPLGSSSILYRAYASAVRRGDFVFVRSRQSRGFGIYPMALFTDESLEWLVAHIEAQQ